MKIEQMFYDDTRVLTKGDKASLITKRFIESKYRRIPIRLKLPCK